MSPKPLSPVAERAQERAEASDERVLRAALVRHRGAVRRVAEELGVSEDTIHRRIARYGLRAWLDETYPRAARQPGKKKSRA